MILSSLPPLLACATCMGNASDHATRAAGVSIFFLLIVIFLVGGALVRFFFFLARCERRMTAVPALITRREAHDAASRSNRE